MADPGFPRGGGANSPGGCQHTILPKFPKNCIKSKEFGPGGASPAPPLRSATGLVYLWILLFLLTADLVVRTLWLKFFD